jgi:hypothetical protein
LRNSGRVIACLGAGTKRSVADGGRALARDKFQAFKTGVRMMGRE